jgi:competence protein ComEA
MDAQCGRCHSLSRVTSKTKTAAEWKITVDRMITHGANLTPEQEQALIDYLAKNY